MVSADKYIDQGNFCQITAEHLEESGLKRGRFVFVAGMKAFPVTEEDPYTQRIQCLVHKCSKKGIVDTESGFFVVDPTSLSKVGKKKQEAMDKTLQGQVDQMEFLHADSPSEEVH